MMEEEEEAVAEATALTVERQVTWLRIVRTRRRGIRAMEEVVKGANLLVYRTQMPPLEEDPGIKTVSLSQDLLGATQPNLRTHLPFRKQNNQWRAGTDRLSTLQVGGISQVSL